MNAAMSALVARGRAIADQHREEHITEVATQIIVHMEVFAEAAIGLEYYAGKAPWELEELSDEEKQRCAALELEKTHAQQATTAIVKSLIYAQTQF